MKATKQSTISEAIIFIKFLDEQTILVVDSDTTLYYLDRKTLKVKDELALKVVHHRYVSSVVDVTSDVDFLATLSSNAKEAHLYNVKTKQIVSTIDRHHGEVSCVAIDPKNRYMFSSGDDGKSFAIDIETKKLAFTLPMHKDIVTDIAFNKTAQLVATSSYDRTISIFNLSLINRVSSLKAHSAPIMKICFLNKNRLFSIDKKGAAIVWDLRTKKVVKRLEGIHDDVIQICVGNDGKFLFLASKLGYIMVYDLETYSLINRKYIKLTQKITVIHFDENVKELVVATDNGELFFYYIYEGIVFLTELLKNNKYAELYKFADEHPFLKYTKTYLSLEALWNKIVSNAKVLFGKNNPKKAISLFSSFLDIPGKKQVMSKLVEEYSEFGKFVMLYKQGKISLAYNLANKHPMYKETSIYEAMELSWKRTFALAKKHIQNPKATEKVKEIFAPFRGVSEKTALIQELFTNAQVLNRFKIAIGQKDYKLTQELVKIHPFLKKTQDYELFTNYIDNLYIKAQQLLQKDETNSAIKYLRVLMDFDDYKEEAKSDIAEIDATRNFFNALDNDDLTLAYNLLDEYESLKNTKDGEKLQEKWEIDLYLANDFALKGDVANIKQTLESYIQIKSKNLDISKVVSKCYVAQLKSAIKTRLEQSRIEKGVKNYMLYFGLNEEISTFFKIFKKYYENTKLSLKSQTKGDVYKWRPTMIVNSILD